MAGKIDDLMRLREGEDGGCSLCGAGLVEVDEYLIHDDGQGLAAGSEIRNVPEAEGKIKLLGGPPAQVLRPLRPAFPGDDLNRILADRRDDLLVPAPCDEPEKTGCVAYRLRLLLLLEALPRFREQAARNGVAPPLISLKTNFLDDLFLIEPESRYGVR